MSIFSLGKEQQKAFNRLKKAYKDCENLKILLVNQYGTIHAYDKRLVCDFGDTIIPPDGIPISYDEARKVDYNLNTIQNIDPGRADDEIMWVLGLTEKGLEIYNDAKNKI